MFDVNMEHRILITKKYSGILSGVVYFLWHFVRHSVFFRVAFCQGPLNPWHFVLWHFVPWHYVRDSQGCRSKTPENIETEIGLWLITSSTPYNRANFHGNRSKWVCSPNRWNITQLWLSVHVPFLPFFPFFQGILTPKHPKSGRG